VYKDAQAPELPARLGRYELLAPIASGGMAEVFAARVVGDPAPAKLVAIKRMKEELLGEARFVSMFLDEARIAAHLSHPNVVGLEDLGRTEQGVPYLVMDLVVGASVAELLRGDPGLERKAVPLEIAVELIAQAAEGLHAAHEAKDALGTPLEIVHRDVSPQNILVGLDGRARISDFGIARAVARLTRTATGELKGKARYFSPEQAHGKDADRRSDLFALGVVLWEMLALQPLCSGRSLPEVLRAVSAQAVPDVRDRRPEVPEPVARVLARALERDLEARVATGEELARCLRAAARDSGLRAPQRLEIGGYVESRVGQSITRLLEAIRARSPVPVDLPFEGDTTLRNDAGFEDEVTVVDPSLGRGTAAPGGEASARSGGVVTIPDRFEDARMRAAVSEAVEAMRAREVAPAGPRAGVRTLPLGVMAPADMPAAAELLPQAETQAPATQAPATQETTSSCQRCGRTVSRSTLGFAEDGATVCKRCLSAEVIEVGDRSAVSTIAGMGYGALLSGVVTLCTSWIPYWNLVPAALAIGSAVAFFVNVARSPEARRRMGWQLPAATVCAAIGLALGLLAPLAYLLVALGLAAGAG
jgi:serine/threonine-protein kinase